MALWPLKPYEAFTTVVSITEPGRQVFYCDGQSGNNFSEICQFRRKIRNSAEFSQNPTVTLHRLQFASDADAFEFDPSTFNI